MPSMQELQERYDSLNKRVGFGDGPDYWKIPHGKSTIRIAPGVTPDEWFYFEKGIHWNVGPEDSRVLCPRVFNLKCPICELCEYINKNKGASEAEKRTVDEIRVKLRALFYIVDYADQSQVQVLDAPLTVLRDLQRYMLNPEYGDFTDLQRGRDVYLERTGKGMTDTRYNTMLRPAQTPAPEVLIEQLPALKPLHQLESVLSYDEIYRLMYNVSPPNAAPTSAAPVPPPMKPPTPAHMPPPPKAVAPPPVSTAMPPPLFPTQDGIPAPYGTPQGIPTATMQYPVMPPTPVTAPTTPTMPTPVMRPPSAQSQMEIPPELQGCFGHKWGTLPQCPKCKLVQACMNQFMTTTK